MAPVDDDPAGEQRAGDAKSESAGSDATGEATDGDRPDTVYCPECGTKASADWAFCRHCEASLADAAPADGDLRVRTDGEEVDLSEHVGEVTGCRKCGHADVDVQDVAASSDGFARLLDVQTRRFRAVSCTRCGYTEFYRGRRPNEAAALFVR